MKRLLSLILVFSLITYPVFSSVTFDNTDDILDCGTTDDILKENAALTISAWIKPASGGEGSGASFSGGRIVDRSSLIFRVGDDATTAKHIDFAVTGSTLLEHKSSANSITFSTWQHVLVTWDGSTTAANIHIYVNGTEVSYSSTSNGVSPNDNSTANTYIGNNAATTRTFDGVIDEVYIYTSVLNASDIALLANSRTKRMGFKTSVQPKRYWAMDECTSGATCSTVGQFRDITGNGGNCSPSNSPTGSSGIIGYSPGVIQP